MIIRFCIFILLLCAEVTITYSQSVRPDSLPRSFTYISATKPLNPEREIQTITTGVPNVDSVEKIERVLDSLGAIRPYRFGIEIPVNISKQTQGTLDELEDGSFIWRLRVICPGAKSINFSYNSTSLPRGAFLYAYNADRTSLEGPWYDRNTRSGKKLGTFPVQGNTVIIEAYIPRGKVNEVVLVLGKIIYGFREMTMINDQNLSKNNQSSIQTSGSCNFDVNCSAGNDWCREKYSVAKLLIGNSAFCTGSLLNNVREDFTPYILTAFHCLDGNRNHELSQAEQDQVGDWSFQFGNMREGCSTGNTWVGVSYSGSVFRAGWNTSDFTLLEMDQQPISGTPISGSNYFLDVYYNGWDRTGNVPNNTTCLHHPSGDIMKIAHDNDPPDINSASCTDDNIDNHWRVFWQIGVTEPGSSGSPLIDNNHRTIGQLHGGLSSCSNPTGCDFYGRLSLSWGGGGTDATRLSNWLDPDGTGATTLNGIKLDNLQYGDYFYSGSYQRNAYDRIRIGSGDDGYGSTIWWTVGSGVTMNVKAGREIQVRGCTWIKSGAEARLYIGTLDCSEVVRISDNESDYSICTSGSTNPDPNGKQTLYDNSHSNDMLKGEISIIPNPATDEIQILGNVVADVELFSSIGLSVLRVEKGVHKVDVSQLSSGIYYARIPTATGEVVKSFMIIR